MNRSEAKGLVTVSNEYRENEGGEEGDEIRDKPLTVLVSEDQDE